MRTLALRVGNIICIIITIYLYSIIGIYLLNSISTFDKHLHTLSTYSSEELKEKHFSYLGYTYIRDMTNDIPDEKLMPITRYSDHTKLAHLYLPKYRNNIDDKLLIGIGLTETDLAESVITTANLLQFKRNKYFFTFQTIHDYDSLTSIIFKYNSPNDSNDNILKVALYYKYPKQDSKKSWSVNLPSNQSEYKFVLPEPMSQFSFGRGRTDFHLVINPEHNIQIQEVQILGKKVDLDEYKTINKNGASFLAVKKGFYQSALARNDVPWISYIDSVKNVD